MVSVHIEAGQSRQRNKPLHRLCRCGVTLTRLADAGAKRGRGVTGLRVTQRSFVTASAISRWEALCRYNELPFHRRLSETPTAQLERRRAEILNVHKDGQLQLSCTALSALPS
ncbi:hypothetical protein MHYP_G00197350 [Metynnis hypsauchen]